MSLNYNFKEKLGLRTLQDICIQVLIDNKHALGDVGDVPISLLIPILSHCTPAELERIEDKTQKHSNRDIRVETWSIWKRIYMSKFGKPRLEEVPPLVISNEAMDINGTAEDIGDYRKLYASKTRMKEEQTKKLAAKLRKLKENEEISKERTKAKRISAISALRRPRSKTKNSNARLTSSTTRPGSGMTREEFYARLSVYKKRGTIMKRR